MRHPDSGASLLSVNRMMARSAGLAYALARQRRAGTPAPAGKAPGERLAPAPHK